MFDSKSGFGPKHLELLNRERRLSIGFFFFLKMLNLLRPSQLSLEGGLSNVLLFTNIGLVGMKVSMVSFLFADRERSILRPRIKDEREGSFSE